MKIKELYSKDEKITFESYANKFGIIDIEEYKNPSGKYIDNYILYDDIIYAINELKYYYELSKKENVSIYMVQDGDCDGICSTVILYQYLVNLSSNWNLRILIHTSKQRGLDDENIMNEIRKNQPDLVIVTDAGTNNVLQSEELCELGIGLIVIDHHDYQTPIQKGVLINNQNPLYNVQRNGSGALVVHKFLNGLDNEFNKDWSNCFIDMVALSLISDSMNMSEMENRTYYHYGLETMDCINNKFLCAMFDRFIGDKPYTQKDISFNIIPKINSICRCQDQELKQRLLLGFLGMDDINEVLDICEKAHKNQTNKVNEIIKNNKEKIEKIANNDSLVVFVSKDIPRSYSGLVAGKIMNLCGGKPTIAGFAKDNYFIGSLRSPIPLRSELSSNNLVDFCSGHEESAGIGIKQSNIEELVDYYNNLNLSYEPCMEVLKSYTTKSINKSLWKVFEPYKVLWGKGIENPTVHIKFIYEPSKVNFLDRYGVFLNYFDNGINIKWDYIDKQKKVDMKLGYIDNSIGRDKFIRKDDKKRYTMNVIGTIEDNYTIKADKWWLESYEPKSLKDIF